MTSSSYRFSFKIFNGFTPYISEDAAQKLKTYKYAGGDSGIAYRCFYNPLALKLVDYLPDTVAPNLITLIGFMFNVIPFIVLFSAYGTDFSGKIPIWFHIAIAISYLIYRILDEMDGKQARKTGNSSPLGLLFDHGCDSITATLFTATILKCLQNGNNILILLGVGAVGQSFYFCTLEEYYIGGLYLGVGNGVTDGSVLLIALFLLQAFTDSAFFEKTVSFNMNDQEITMKYIHILAWMTLGSQVLASLYKKKKKQEGEEDHGEEVVYTELIQQIIAFYLLWGLVLYASICQENPIIDNYPLIPVLLFTIVYSHNTIHIQVSHVSKKNINQYVFFLVILGISFLAQWHYIICVIDEMTRILGIKSLLREEEPLLRQQKDQKAEKAEKKKNKKKKSNKSLKKSPSGNTIDSNSNSK
ncbi:cdpalcohol phosphatidyltransferase [Stylonychia lemnae]|uniref:Cdpalcohol phosphatidyltransferase n=1 Tax=Stylonychia lemnae TaxID=5949 RepID=A0A078AEP6_STYLE|nr:cdpalcohol phosphatidyltransferase [Stylonychia lemnae]|eukprot:CDW80744.1 cdpalcohol phosphatidyltransferase [Stylonychia lemnae]